MKKDVLIPALGESITEATLSKFIVPPGGGVKEGDPIVVLESEKASVEVPAPASGVVTYIVKEGDNLKVGSVFAQIDTEGKATVESKPAPAPTSTSVPTPSPALRAQEPQKEVIPTGGSRISPDEYLAGLQKPTTPAPTPQQPLPKPQQRREPMSRLRKTIAKKLVQVKNETAMLTTFNEVDMSAIVTMRNREKEEFQKKCGAKLTFVPFFVKACVSALRAIPEVNAYIDGDDIVHNTHVHMGMAVSTESGLVVPVMRNVDQMSFVDIAKTLATLATKARDRKLTIQDMSGGTFTITNGGVFGSMLSTPILNPPESAILGMHNIVDRVVAVNGKMEIRPVMYLALSYDHRIIDGKSSVTFLVHVKEMLEDPSKFLLYE